ncbi:MAG: SufD family Fe-S cluster assembly protein [Chlamydiae bacterium]|nr:SufD family Fe-S cluster assembly protein [Chlamydiota bacterium]MBI3276265.1 SufD family Fe-S cluster assembly protein [Chlamydiota bacterium]
MSEEAKSFIQEDYKYGFITDIESEMAPRGLDEDIVRYISEKKNEPVFLLEWRLKAYRHWLKMSEPQWPNVHYPAIDYQNIIYYSAPKKKKLLSSLEEVDKELLVTFEKLGIPLEEQKRLSGVAVDAVFDSVSVATTFKAQLEKFGIIFCSFSEAVQHHPDLIKKYLGSVVPYSDNFFAALNSAVFSDGSFCYIPKGVRCPMELSTYFRINTADTGQFERTLIIAEDGAYVSYLEGCLPGWEEITTGYELKNIRDLVLGETVLNHEGVETKAAKLMKRRYRGDLVEITPRSPGNKFSLTPKHPVLAIRRESVRSSLRGQGRWADIHSERLSQTEPEFIPVGELQPGDLLVFPINKVKRDDSSLSDDFLRLLGYYVAEGCATRFNGCDAVEICLGDHEENLIKDVVSLIKKVLGKTPSVTYDRVRHGAYIVVYSKELSAQLVKHGGKYAIGKRFSKTVMDLPPARQKLALDTYYLGDGSVSREGKLIRIRAATISKQLAFQIQEILARQGIFAYINVREAFDEKMKDGKIIRHKTRYVLFYAENTIGRRALRREGYFLLPVCKIRRVPYDDYVYNFETATEPHSYLVKGFAVHNCTAPIRDKNQLHAAVVELVCLENAQIKYSTVQNWYAGDKDGKGGIYNFVTKRGKCAGKKSKISWTQVETGSSITWKYPSVILMGDNSIGEFYSVALTNNHQQADTGTKMIHVGKNTKSTIISKGISAKQGSNTYRGLVKVLPHAENVRNYTQCDSLLLGDQCSANTFPYIEVQNNTAKVEHEASTSKISEEQLFYCKQRGISGENAVNMIINGFCKEVFRNLPMEFAVEASKLLGVSLEGSVG